MIIRLTNETFRDVKQLFFMGYSVDGRNKVGITLLGIKLHDTRLEILKAYTTYRCEFCVFSVAKLLSIRDEKNLLLIVIWLEKTCFCLNIIYSLPKHIHQWFRYKCYQLHRNSRLYFQDCWVATWLRWQRLAAFRVRLKETFVDLDRNYSHLRHIW